MSEEREQRITVSMYRCGNKCMFKLLLAYIKGIRPDRPAKPFRMGDAFHLSQQRRSERPDVPIAQIVGEIMAEYGETRTKRRLTPQEFYEQEIEKAQIAASMLAHHWYYEQLDNTYTVIENESSFEIPLVNPDALEVSGDYVLAGKKDKVVKLSDGRVMLQEFKTTSDDLSPKSNYWKRWSVDRQIALYFIACEMNNMPIDGVILDVCKKPSAASKPKKLSQKATAELLLTARYNVTWRGEEEPSFVCDCKIDLKPNAFCTVDGTEVDLVPGKKEGTFTMTETLRMFQARLIADICRRPGEFFVRKVIDRTKPQIKEAMGDFWDWAKNLNEAIRNNRFPKNDYACTGFGVCEYLDLCSTGFDPHNYEHLPDGFVKVDDVHQELMEDD